jgi:hypothetical protein
MLVDSRKERWKAPALWPLEVGEYKFEQVQSFMYLGTKVNIWNDISEEVKTRIMAANRSCFGLQNHLKSWILSRTTKIQLHKTLIVMYGSECWTLSQSDEQKLDVFERKVLQKIYGPIQYSDIWRSRYNSEL